MYVFRCAQETFYLEKWFNQGEKSWSQTAKIKIGTISKFYSYRWNLETFMYWKKESFSANDVSENDLIHVFNF